MAYSPAPSPRNAAPAGPLRGSAIFTFGMVGVLMAIQAYCSTLSPGSLAVLFDTYALVPGRLTVLGDYSPAALLTLLSHAFLHANWQHVIFNVYALVAFGLMVERIVGLGRTVVIYTISGLAGALLFMALHPDLFVHLVGASGAISGLFGAALVVAPPQMRKAVIGNAAVWFALNVIVPALASFSGGNIAWEAHLGGFIGGAAVAWMLRPSWPHLRHSGGMRPGGGERRDQGDRNNPGKTTIAQPVQPKKQDGPVIRR